MSLDVYDITFIFRAGGNGSGITGEKIGKSQWSQFETVSAGDDKERIFDTR